MDAAVVVGASTGGIPVLQQIAAALPPDFPVPLLVVLHIGPHRSHLPDIIGRVGPLPARHPDPGETIRAGTIYIAPPDRHLLVEDGRAVLQRGPKENWARPAIDPLFRSAAARYRRRLVGVILTGKLNDGTAGLYEVKRRGGTAMVQDPADAVDPSMPRSAIQHVCVDHVAAMSELPGLLVRLALAASRAPTSHAQIEEPMMGTVDPWRPPVAQVCPDCGGAMSREDVGDLVRYRCHIGHSFTAETLAEAQLLNIDQRLEAAFRSLKERAAICAEIATRSDRAADADPWRLAETEARERAAVLEKLLQATWIRPEIG